MFHGKIWHSLTLVTRTGVVSQLALPVVDPAINPVMMASICSWIEHLIGPIHSLIPHRKDTGCICCVVNLNEEKWPVVPPNERAHWLGLLKSYLQDAIGNAHESTCVCPNCHNTYGPSVFALHPTLHFECTNCKMSVTPDYKAITGSENHRFAEFYEILIGNGSHSKKRPLIKDEPETTNPKRIKCEPVEAPPPQHEPTAPTEPERTLPEAPPLPDPTVQPPQPEPEAAIPALEFVSPPPALKPAMCVQTDNCRNEWMTKLLQSSESPALPKQQQLTVSMWRVVNIHTGYGTFVFQNSDPITNKRDCSSYISYLCLCSTCDPPCCNCCPQQQQQQQYPRPATLKAFVPIAAAAAPKAVVRMDVEEEGEDADEKAIDAAKEFWTDSAAVETKWTSFCASKSMATKDQIKFLLFGLIRFLDAIPFNQMSFYLDARESKIKRHLMGYQGTQPNINYILFLLTAFVLYRTRQSKDAERLGSVLHWCSTKKLLLSRYVNNWVPFDQAMTPQRLPQRRKEAESWLRVWLTGS